MIFCICHYYIGNFIGMCNPCSSYLLCFLESSICWRNQTKWSLSFWSFGRHAEGYIQWEVQQLYIYIYMNNRNLDSNSGCWVHASMSFRFLSFCIDTVLDLFTEYHYLLPENEILWWVRGFRVVEIDKLGFKVPIPSLSWSCIHGYVLTKGDNRYI